MHQLLFVHKIIIFSSKCFEPQVLIFRMIQLYTCILYCHYLWEFLVACQYTAWVPIAVVREHRIAQLSISSRVGSYMYCILGTVWGSELVFLCEVNVRLCSVHCVFVLCHEGVLQSGLYLQQLICCSVTLTSNAKNNWCVILNISDLLQNYFCLCVTCERDSVCVTVSQLVGFSAPTAADE